MNVANDLDPGELAALLHFYADAGVEWLVDDLPTDRIAQFAEQKAAKRESRGSAAGAQRDGQDQAAAQQASSATRSRPTGKSSAPAGSSSPPSSTVAVPDGEAVAAARFAADSARSLGELKTALEAFNGCNLKNSARSTVFASGDPSSGIMVIGPMPNADDDRDGLPFCGRAGDLLDRMLQAIGLSRDTVVLTTVIPWRPPGNRMPSQAELEICRPFIERQVALVEPRHLLLLGNFPARFFLGGGGTIHSMRGEWRKGTCGTMEIDALATFHPQELLAAPANKAMAWRDLLTLKSRLAAISG